MGQFHKLLGVDNNATHEEIKKAFRALAVKYHPDKNPDKDTTAIFQELSNAYQALISLPNVTVWAPCLKCDERGYIDITRGMFSVRNICNECNGVGCVDIRNQSDPGTLNYT